MSNRFEYIENGKRKIMKPILNTEAINMIYEVNAAAKSARRLPDSMKYYLGRKINGLRVTYDNYETVDRKIPEDKLDEMRGEADKLIAMLRAYR